MSRRKEIRQQLLNRASKQQRQHEVQRKLFDMQQRVNNFIEQNKHIEQEILQEQEEPRSVKMLNTLHRYIDDDTRYSQNTEDSE